MAPMLEGRRHHDLHCLLLDRRHAARRDYMQRAAGSLRFDDVRMVGGMHGRVPDKDNDRCAQC